MKNLFQILATYTKEKRGCVHEINEHGFEDEVARRIVNENIKEE